ncbi:MAG: YitT family protein [Bacillota bacterium]
MYRLIRAAWPYLAMPLSAMIAAVAFRTLLVPNEMIAGGIFGIGLLLSRLTGLPAGALILLLNVPVFALGLREFGTKFIVLTALFLVAFSALMDLVHLPVLTDDRLLAAIFGGVLSGIGYGMALRAGGSSGGLDVIGKALHKRLGIDVGEALMVLNGLIIGAAGLVFGPEAAMYTLISMFASSRTLDALLTARAKRTALIVTDRPEEVAERILRDLHRGVTFLEGEGAFTHARKRILLCVVTRYEVARLKELVLGVDPQAFMTISETAEVVGRFHPFALSLPFRRR